MKRIHVFLEDNQIKFLKDKGGKLSEHIRYAVETYIHDIQRNELNVNSSKSKAGESNE